MSAPKEQIYNVVDQLLPPKSEEYPTWQPCDCGCITYTAFKLSLCASMQLFRLSGKNPKVYERYGSTRLTGSDFFLRSISDAPQAALQRTLYSATQVASHTAQLLFPPVRPVGLPGSSTSSAASDRFGPFRLSGNRSAEEHIVVKRLRGRRQPPSRGDHRARTFQE